MPALRRPARPAGDAQSEGSTLQISTQPALTRPVRTLKPSASISDFLGRQFSLKRKATTSGRKRPSEKAQGGAEPGLPPLPDWAHLGLTAANLNRHALIAADRYDCSWYHHRGEGRVQGWRYEVAEEVALEKAMRNEEGTVAHAVAELSVLLTTSPFVRSFKVASLALPPSPAPNPSPVGSHDIWLDSATPSPDVLDAAIQTAQVAEATFGQLVIAGQPTAGIPSAGPTPSSLPYMDGNRLAATDALPFSFPTPPNSATRPPPLRSATTGDTLCCRGPATSFKVEPPPRKASLPFSNLAPGPPLPSKGKNVPVKAAALLGFGAATQARMTEPARSGFAASDASLLCQPSRPTTQLFNFRGPRPSRARDDSRSVAESSSSSPASSVGRLIHGFSRPSFSSFSTPPSASPSPSTSLDSEQRQRRREPFAKRKEPPTPLDLPTPTRDRHFLPSRRSKSGPEPAPRGAPAGGSGEADEIESLADMVDPATSRWQRLGGADSNPSQHKIGTLVRKLSQGKMTRTLSGRRKHKRAATTAA